ncbi:MAG: hypothetical protein ACW99F_09010 [Candidatus Hodarchaeales archaeon]|jgi:hypothetical protein
MPADILAEEQLKLELLRVLSRHFLRQLEELLRSKTGAFFPVDRLSNLELGKRLGNRKELQIMTVTIVDSLQNKEFKIDLAFKFHIEKEAAIKEANGAIWLEEQLKPNSRVKTAQLLFFSQEQSLLIYEGLSESSEYFDSDLDIPQKLFLSGSALPYVHGVFKQKIIVDRYLHLITETLNGLKISPDSKNELKNLFKDPLKKMGVSPAGANCFGDFHPGNLMFREISSSIANTGDIRMDQTLTYLIDPSFIDKNNFIDRAEDLGTFFSKFAYSEYSLNQTFDNTISDLEIFCKGYDYTSSYNGLSIVDYYPKGTTFDFHIALGILMESMFKSRLAGYTEANPVIQNSVEAAKLILSKNPFQIFG